MESDKEKKEAAATMDQAPDERAEKIDDVNNRVCNLGGSLHYTMTTARII